MTHRLYFDQSGIPYIPNVGSKILNLLNGVKHTIDSFAYLYSIDKKALSAVVRSEIGPTVEIRAAIEKHTPLRIRDLYPREYQYKFPIVNDTESGVVICKSETTEKTKRQTFRGLEDSKVLFYTYADTAMSVMSLFRPEWITEHFVDNGDNPDSIPDWAFNNGHFEHQMTYFIGPVNFHWMVGNKKYVRQMSTGDVNYITPFVPHTFTTRKEGMGLILAVTYGGSIAEEGYQSKIQKTSLSEYINSLRDINKSIPSDTELVTDKLGGVIIKHHDLNDLLPSYKVINLLSGIPFQRARCLMYEFRAPFKKSINVEVERWGYNVGDSPIVLSWDNRDEFIDPGDSFIIRSQTTHSFSATGRVVVMEINPEMGQTDKELALIERYSGMKGLERVHSENTQWF